MAGASARRLHTLSTRPSWRALRVGLILVAISWVMTLAPSQAAPPTINGKHGAIGLSCASCHGTDAPTTRAPATVCGQCHGGYDKLAQATASANPNPHQSHQGEVRCTLCHKVHQPSVLFCNECHQFDLKVK
jgi:fumarate reductase flavoprotein subunit